MTVSPKVSPYNAKEQVVGLCTYMCWNKLTSGAQIPSFLKPNQDGWVIKKVGKKKGSSTGRALERNVLQKGSTRTSLKKLNNQSISDRELETILCNLWSTKYTTQTSTARQGGQNSAGYCPLKGKTDKTILLAINCARVGEGCCFQNWNSSAMSKLIKKDAFVD